MTIPVEISFEHLDHSDAIEARIRKEAEKLSRYDSRLMEVRCVVARPQHRHRHGDHFEVRLSLQIPGAPDITIRRNPPADGARMEIGVAIRSAFDAARRRLQDIERRRSGQVKHHNAHPTGRILALHPDRDHGFIAADDGREIYFHRNSVAQDGFDTLTLGTRVSFSESRGNAGPQASFVSPLGGPAFS